MLWNVFELPNEQHPIKKLETFATVWGCVHIAYIAAYLWALNALTIVFSVGPFDNNGEIIFMMHWILLSVIEAFFLIALKSRIAAWLSVVFHSAVLLFVVCVTAFCLTSPSLSGITVFWLVLALAITSYLLNRSIGVAKACSLLNAWKKPPTVSISI